MMVSVLFQSIGGIRHHHYKIFFQKSQFKRAIFHEKFPIFQNVFNFVTKNTGDVCYNRLNSYTERRFYYEAYPFPCASRRGSAAGSSPSELGPADSL
jgi:hypothetical protein